MLANQTESSELVIHPDRYRPVRGGNTQPIMEGDKESNNSYCVVEDPQRRGYGSYEMTRNNLSGTSALSSLKRSNNNLDVSEHLSPYRRAKYSAMVRADAADSSPEISPLRRGGRAGILKPSSGSPKKGGI